MGAGAGDDGGGPGAGGRLDDDPGDGGGQGQGGGDDGDDDDDPDDDGDGDGGQWTPPAREDFEKLQRIAANRKIERNEARTRARQLEARIRELEGGGQGGGGEGGKGGQQQPTGEQAAEDRWRMSAARNSAATQLSAAGFTGTAKQAKRLTSLLNLDDAEPDRDGDFDFEDDIEDLKSEYPGLFRNADDDRRPPARRPSTADRGRRTPNDAGQDPTQRTSERLLRSAGIRPRRG